MEIAIYLGLALALVGNVMILIAAFRQSILWGLASLIVPFAILGFVVTHWSETKKGFLILVLGGILVVTGVSLSPAQP
jgi:hypothetical protein